MIKGKKLWSAVGAAFVAIGLLAAGASAQQPPSGDKDPAKLPLGDVQPPARPVQPGAQPGQPGQPGQMQPGQQGPRPIPGQRPGMGPGGRMPLPRPQPRPAPEPVEEKGHAAAHHCPGHGPLDSPHAPNWWQGIIGVNNEAVKWSAKPDEHGHFHREDPGYSQLLWRYENAKDECDPKNQPPPFLASILNFGLLAFVIFRFGKKPLQEALSARKKTMMAEIDNAQRLKAEAEKRLSDYEDKLQNLDETLEQMKADYAAQSEAERKHVLAEAEERRVRMRRDVEFRLEQELKAAKQLLLAEAVEKAVVAAEEILKKKVSGDDQSRTADEYLKGLATAWKGEAANSGNARGAA